MEWLPWVQLAMTGLIVPAFGYIIKLEKRLTRLEVKIEMICNELSHKGVVK